MMVKLKLSCQHAESAHQEVCLFVQCTSEIVSLFEALKVFWSESVI